MDLMTDGFWGPLGNCLTFPGCPLPRCHGGCPFHYGFSCLCRLGVRHSNKLVTKFEVFGSIKQENKNFRYSADRSSAKKVRFTARIKQLKVCGRVKAHGLQLASSSSRFTARTESDITGYHGVDGPCTIETHTDKPTISRPRRLGKAESAEVDKFYQAAADNGWVKRMPKDHAEYGKHGINTSLATKKDAVIT